MNELGKVWKTISTWAQELKKDLGESLDNNKYLGSRVERLGGDKIINTWAQELTKDLGESFDNNKYLGTRVNERLGGEFGLNFFQLIRD